MENPDSKSLGEVHGSVEVNHKGRPWKKVLAFFGPAYLVSVGYMDPGNWATDLEGGSRLGYSLLWILLLSNLTALLLQSMSARMGIAGGVDLAQASRKLFPGPINLILYFLAEIAIAATDLAEVIGMAIGLHLLFGIPKMAGVLITFFDTFLLLYLMNKGMKKMEAFIISLVSIIAIAFIGELFISRPQFSEISSGFLPSGLNDEALYIAIAIIGATVMPHNLYLHSALVQTRRIEKNDKGIREAIKMNNIDSAMALNMAFFVNASILILAATAFYKQGIEVTDIEDAHRLLSNIFGPVAPVLFAVALIAAGQSSTITGTLAGQIIMEGYLNLRLRPWLRRLVTRSLAIVPAIITILWLGEDSLLDLLVFSQVLLSLQLGFAIIPMLHFVASKEWMNGFQSSRWVLFLGWIAASLIVYLNGRLIIETCLTWADASPWYFDVLIWTGLLGIAALLVYIIVIPWVKKRKGREIVYHRQTKDLSQLENISYRRIAIALDFGAGDLRALSHALSFHKREVQFVLFHVVESPGAQLLGQNLQNTEVKEDQQRLEEYVSIMRQNGCETTGILGFGSPIKELIRLTQAHKIDMLIMNSHGHRGIDDVIYGATVDSVRHQLKIPVLVISG